MPLWKILLSSMLALVALAGCRGRELRQPPAPGGRPIPLAKRRSNHPYGNPAAGVLPWENNGRFKRMAEKASVPVRMGAFRTTLPDPLPGEEGNVAVAADKIAGTVVKPGGVFSLNGTIGPYTRERGYRQGPVYIGDAVSTTVGGGVCKIATTLYNVAVLADLPILERRPHGMPVPYVPPGQDATVTYGVADLKFRNDTGAPLLLWADTVGKTLYMAVYGRRPPRVVWHHEILARQPARTVCRTNARLSPGTERMAQAGADGLTVRSWLTLIYPGGRTVTRNLGVDRYRPLPRLVERGPSR